MVCHRAVSAGIVKYKTVVIMAALEVQNNLTASEPPPMAGQQEVAGGDWWDEFKPVEKVFAVLGGVLFIAMVATYVGAHIGNSVLFIVGVVVLSFALVGMASLFFPLSWILLKGFLAWWRRRASERAQKV